jgi:hypothetical protein
MKRNKKTGKVVRIRKKPGVFAGLLFLAIAAYLVFVFISTVTEKHVSIFEVVKKNVTDTVDMRGIILRNDEVIRSQKSGYVNFFLPEGAKCRVNDQIYSISADESLSEQLSSDMLKTAATSDSISNTRNLIKLYRASQDPSRFDKANNFNYSIDCLAQTYSRTRAKKVRKILNENKAAGLLDIVSSQKSGIVSYIYDGMEGKTADQITPEDFKNMSDSWDETGEGSIEAGDPVYKLITDENWSIVVELDKDKYDAVATEASVSCVLKKAEATVYPEYHKFTRGGKYFAEIKLTQYMIEYLDDRYADVELNFSSASGLKVPVSSLLKKDTYTIPVDYLYRGNNGLYGVYLEDQSKSSGWKLHYIELYSRDYDEKTALIGGQGIKEGSVITKLNDGGEKGVDPYVIGPPELKEGVYNCNDGYARFVTVDKIYSNNEYAIVKDGEEFGLANYDHIILNADAINDSQLIY